MSESNTGQSLSLAVNPKPKGKYTGERLKVLRPETYRRVVELLAEPRMHVSYREICRRCHVTDDTVKAVEKREATPIAARKQELLIQAARIAKLAADRVEDQIETANLPQAVITFGVMTDKVSLLSGEPDLTIRHEHLHAHVTGDDLLAFALARKAKRLTDQRSEISDQKSEASTGNA